jgi:transcriptional regulator with XRE-family HTH domain
MNQKIKQDNKILGKNIRKLRMKARLTQEQIVAKMQVKGCEITRSTYAKIEAGLSNIKVTELISLKEILDVEYNEFFVVDKSDLQQVDL